jgi:hypothetical protein
MAKTDQATKSKDKSYEASNHRKVDKANISKDKRNTDGKE